MPKRSDINSILIVGAGPIVIGQGCEFDYSGTQACNALREEGYKVILINSNPATIMTDPDIADVTFIEPITPENIEKIIIGKPLKLNNMVHDLEKDIIDLIKSLNKYLPDITIERIDERYTSKISKKIIHQLHSKKKIRMDKSIIDKISASLILESYLIKMQK